MHSTAALLLLLTGLSGPQSGDELPTPRRVPAVVQPLPPLGFYRPDPYDVWQLYSVGPGGLMRARVINTPHGAFYLYNGKPYPWTSVFTRNHVPD